MSKKHPSPAEACWRANYRYRRMLASWRGEAAIGDPLGLVAILRRSGTMAAVELARISTARRAAPSR